MNARDTRLSTEHTSSGTRPSLKQKGVRQRPKTGWLAITGLLLLGVLPVVGGVSRLGEVSSGSEQDMLWTSTAAIVTHIVAMTIFCLVGAFQFSPALRVRRSWHRTAGRVLIPAGFLAALSSIWLAVFFGGPRDEFALAMVRLVFAVPMLVFLVLAVRAITRRNFVTHGVWMTRAYAIAISGGTQALVFALWTLTVGEVDAFGEARLVGVGFVISSVVAEMLIRRRSGRRALSVTHHNTIKEQHS